MASGFFALRQWRPGHLLLAWGTYWIGLAAVALGPAIPAVLRATSAAGTQGSISAGVSDGVMQVLIKEGGGTIWSGTASMSAIGFWIVGPPLAFWLAWMIRRRGDRDEKRRASKPAELPPLAAREVTIDRGAREGVERPNDRA